MPYFGGGFAAGGGGLGPGTGYGGGLGNQSGNAGARPGTAGFSPPQKPAAFGGPSFGNQSGNSGLARGGSNPLADRARAEALRRSALPDYEDRAGESWFERNVWNPLASGFGFNERNPYREPLGTTTPGKANWGFDPLPGALGLVGMGLGAPGLGLLGELGSRAMGRPAEINLGPDVFGGEGIGAAQRSLEGLFSGAPGESGFNAGWAPPGDAWRDRGSAMSRAFATASNLRRAGKKDGGTPTAPELPSVPSMLHFDPNMTELQMRAAIATGGTQGDISLYRQQPVFDFYKAMLQRALAGASDLESLLPVENQYLQQGFGLRYNPEPRALLDALKRFKFPT